WILPLFRCLDYGELVFNRTSEQIGDRAYGISHHAGDGADAIPIHTVSPLQKLESSGDESGRRISPHALMQEYLNRTDHLWGMVTNGHRLRLLRDNLSLSRAAYLEFDLEAMFEGGAYADFLLLYLLLHRSRLPQPGAPAAACPLELWREAAQRSGARALDHLRGGVETAIKALGQGFLAHPANEELRARLRAGELDVQGYYRQLLRLVYRMLFLLVAEERDLLFAPLDPHSGGEVARRVYALYYSMDRLRAVSAWRHDPTDRHDDLWRGLHVTFSLLRGESSPLDITALDLPALGVGLFDHDSCPDLDDALVGNPALIEAIRGLSQVTVGKVTRRINYRDMDVEELGSVYES
ncbi:MAG TPA: hypothetical protein VNL71_15025, partial [Chloroflexota bacterium]|nr:hypothetical protein [Chloroflexota bacterium]